MPPRRSGNGLQKKGHVTRHLERLLTPDERHCVRVVKAGLNDDAQQGSVVLYGELGSASTRWQNSAAHDQPLQPMPENCV